VEEERFDAIVVGAGPAGVAAALTMARAGLEVVLLERGSYPGSKNVMGGILYRHQTEQLVPEFWKEAPLERHIAERRFWMLSGDSVTSLAYRTQRFAEEPYNSFSVLRAKFDRWFAEKAEEAGAFLLTDTVVEDVIRRDGKIAGVRTGRDDGDLYADVVIAADGVNSLLAKSAGLHGELASAGVALAVKEIIALPREKIEDRFALEGDEGTAIEVFGDSTAGMFGAGFIYTNQDTISLGTGAVLADFVRTGLTPYDVIDRFKANPMVRKLIDGGETKEYMAHLIPEGGYNHIPRLVTDGFLTVGDAAGFVNAVHVEGSNMAMASGQMAAQTVIEAKERGDFSAAGLSAYERRVRDSFIVEDLRKYRGVPDFFESNPELLELYPGLINDAAREFLSVDDRTKSEKQRKILSMVMQRRPLRRLAGDVVGAWRAMS
jgi:electron transfer flavoprotein-quinone oxidoreductase